MCISSFAGVRNEPGEALWPTTGEQGTSMSAHEQCPRWCAEDVVGPDGVLHRVVLGDVRLVQTPRSTVCQVRRRPRRSPEEQTRLQTSLLTAAGLLGLESRRRHVVMRGNWAVTAPEMAPTAAGEAGVGVAV